MTKENKIDADEVALRDYFEQLTYPCAIHGGYIDKLRETEGYTDGLFNFIKGVNCPLSQSSQEITALKEEIKEKDTEINQLREQLKREMK